MKQKPILIKVECSDYLLPIQGRVIRVSEFESNRMILWHIEHLRENET